MSTQYYAPQQMAPPPAAPAGRGARRQKWVPAAGQRHIVGIESIPGRLVPSGFGPSEVVFDLTDGMHCWYVPQVIADQVYATGIRAGGQIEVTVTGKKKTDLLIVPIQPRLEAASAARTAPAAGEGTTTASRNAQSRNGFHPTPTPMPAPPPPPPPVTPDPVRAAEMSSATACMCSAMCSAVDAVLETQAYAARKNLGLTFSEESVRAIGLSIYISACQGARR